MALIHRGFPLLLASCTLCALCGCNAGAGQTTANGSFSVAIAANGSITQNVTLFVAQFLTPGSAQTLLTANITPAPAQAPQIAWTTGNPTVVSLSRSQFNCQGCPLAPAGAIYAGMNGSSTGVATVTASIGAPVNQSVSVKIYTYASLSAGCGLRYSPAFTFDAGSSPNGTSSDLYVTQVANDSDPLNPCNNSVFSSGVAAVHFPYGGVLIPGSLQTFDTVQASQWSNQTQQVSLGSLGGNIVLFKTKAGAIVKALLPIGPYQVATGGAFAY